MRNNLKKIQGMLKKFKGYEVSPELDRKILKAITITHAELTTPPLGHPSFFAYLKTIFMREIKRYVATAVAAILLFAGVMYFNQNSYAYHLNKAKADLEQLAVLINGKSGYTSFIGVAFAEGESASPSSSADESMIIALSADVVKETEAAIDSAESISKPDLLKSALSEISDFQDESVDVLSDAVAAVNSEDATTTVSSALMATAEDQGLVSKAVTYVEKASSSGEKEVNIDIQTSKDKNTHSKKSTADNGKPITGNDSSKQADAVESYKNAKNAIEDLKASGADDKELSDLQSKLSKAESALNEKKFGRAHGLSSAIQAKGGNIIRKAKKVSDSAIKKAKGDIKNPEDKTSSDKPSDNNGKPVTDPPKSFPSQPAGKDSDIKWSANIKRPSLPNINNPGGRKPVEKNPERK